LADVLSDTDVILALTHVEGRLKRSDPLFLASDPPEGAITVYPDPDGVLRRLPPTLYLDVLNADGSLTRVPHFPVIAALFGLFDQDQDVGIRFDENGVRFGRKWYVRSGELVDYAAPPGPAWHTLSFEDVVRGRFDADLVDGAIVLIGESRVITDHFTLPLTGNLVPGVYYHANVIAQILDGRRFETWLTDGSRQRWLTAILGLIVGLFAWNQRRWWRHRYGTFLLALYVGTGVVIFLGGWVCAAFAMFNRGVLLPLAAPFAAMGLSLATGLAVQWILLSADARRLEERARRIESLFGQCVSPEVLAALKANPRDIAETRVRDVSVLFCDLRGFTATTSDLAPEEVARMLNEYFNHITTAVFENNGFIDKFVGDEVMAVFSVPLAQPDHADRAVRTAIAIKQQLADLNRRRADRGQAPLECGIGIHCGPAAAGHVGSSRRSNYTVVGATVNLAARIEQLTRGGEILISQAVRSQLPEDIRAKHWKRTPIRGASRDYDLYEVDVDAAALPQHRHSGDRDERNS
jgi:adenylate cyclase